MIERINNEKERNDDFHLFESSKTFEDSRRSPLDEKDKIEKQRCNEIYKRRNDSEFELSGKRKEALAWTSREVTNFRKQEGESSFDSSEIEDEANINNTDTSSEDNSAHGSTHSNKRTVQKQFKEQGIEQHIRSANNLNPEKNVAELFRNGKRTKSLITKYSTLPRTFHTGKYDTYQRDDREVSTLPRKRAPPSADYTELNDINCGVENQLLDNSSHSSRMKKGTVTKPVKEKRKNKRRGSIAGYLEDISSDKTFLRVNLLSQQALEQNSKSEQIQNTDENIGRSDLNLEDSSTNHSRQNSGDSKKSSQEASYGTTNARTENKYNCVLEESPRKLKKQVLRARAKDSDTSPLMLSLDEEDYQVSRNSRSRLDRLDAEVRKATTNSLHQRRKVGSIEINENRE